MTRRQVRFIMGNPMLVDTFHPNRWDYLYSMQQGGARRQQERVSVFFNEADQLASLSGDFMPGVSRDDSILGKDNNAAPAEENAPVQQQQPEAPAKPGSLLEQIQRDVDQAKPVPVPSPAPIETSPQ